jgi:hypothetical protein
VKNEKNLEFPTDTCFHALNVWKVFGNLQFCLVLFLEISWKEALCVFWEEGNMNFIEILQICSSIVETQLLLEVF